MSNLIKWRHDNENVWEGTVNGDTEPLITIHGHLCVTDIRHCRKSKEFVEPKHYKLNGMSIDEAKQLAEDLVTGNNFEIHENNRLRWIIENERTSKLLKEAEDFLKELKK